MEEEKSKTTNLSEGEGSTPVNTAQLMADGKKCLAAGDANGAVEFFQEACEHLAEAHGQVSIELAEPYYLYGKALLELSRGSSSVLGAAIPVPEENQSSDEEGDEDEEDGEKEDVEEQTGEAQPSEPTSQSNEDAPNEMTTTEPCQEPEATEPVSSSTTSEAAANGEVPGNKETEKEEESDLEIAWEVLELARVICQKHETNEYRLKLSDVNLLLGEVGLESDQYEQAIMDMQSCLQLRQFVLDPTDRRIAEVHFNLGLAYTLNKQFDDAINSYNKSKETLEKRKSELDGQLATEADSEKKQKLDSEIKDLCELVPDINSKIADVNEMKRLAEERAKEIEEEGETSVGFGNTENDKKVESSSSSAVTDITHLVRKRPAPADEASQPSAKKACTEENGDVVPNGKMAECGGESNINSTTSEQ